MQTQNQITKILSSVLILSAVIMVAAPAQTLAATVPAKTPAHGLFLPNGAMIRPTAKAVPLTPVPQTVLGEKIYAHSVTNNQPIVLTGSQVMVIKDTHYIENGTITLKGSAELIIENSYFEQRNSPAGSASRLDASQYSQVIIKSSKAGFSPWIVWHFGDHSTLTINALKSMEDAGDAQVYYEIANDATANISKAYFTASVSDQANVTIDKSARVSLNLKISGGAIVNEAFPNKITDYSFPGYDDHNIYFHLKITNAVASEWGLTIDPTSNVTVHDTKGLTVGFSVIYPWVGATATFENLHPGHYADNTIGYSQTTAQFWNRNMKIHLINTDVKAWSPMVGNDNTLVLKNSIVSDLPWSWGNAKIILEDSTTTFVRARQSVEVTLENSAVTGDINAMEDGKINLIHSQVLGQKIIQGKGQIVE